VAGELTAEPFEVDHRPVTPAFGLVLRTPGAHAVFSGDTAPVPSLIEAARDADLLVCEVFVDREMQAAPGVRSAETIAAVRAYHMTPRAVATAAKEAGAEALALTHLVPPNADRAALVAEIREVYRKPVILGEDLMSIDVGARTVSLPGAHIGY
jgi:ribonuclease Z